MSYTTWDILDKYRNFNLMLRSPISMQPHDPMSSLNMNDVGITKPTECVRRVEHWDVNNEMLHGNWYATKLNDPNYTKEVFKTVHGIDPNVKLFLNDYSVVAGGASTDVSAHDKTFHLDFHV